MSSLTDDSHMVSDIISDIVKVKHWPERGEEVTDVTLLSWIDVWTVREWKVVSYCREEHLNTYSKILQKKEENTVYITQLILIG